MSTNLGATAAMNTSIDSSINSAAADTLGFGVERKFAWPKLPSRRDPRVAVVSCLTLYVIIGITLLGFNRSFEQIGLMVLVGCSFELALTRLIHQRWIFPISAIITAIGLGILANGAHGLWLPLIPVLISLASKYIITFDGKHIFNPSLFGLLVATIVSAGMISPSPAYQWGGDGYVAIIAFIVTLALLLFVARIQRSVLILSFLGFYLITLAIRAYYTQWHVPAETIILGTLVTPAFYLFTFFMITDPMTSPKSWQGQLLMAFSICVIDLYLHTQESLSTLFKAGFLYFSAVFLFRHGRALLANPVGVFERVRGAFRRISIALGVTCFSLLPILAGSHTLSSTVAGFYLEEIEAEHAGIYTMPGDVLEQVDARIAHVAKWVLSVGDAVAVADVNNDGLQDMFLTYPLKDNASRAALYLNQGDFQFVRQPVPAITAIAESYQTLGIPSGALWLDIDNDSDQDLLLLVSFGKSRLLLNQLTEQGELAFKDVSEQWGLDENTVSVSANGIDIDRDGYLDLMIGNVSPVYLADYEEPTLFNVFNLPKAEYENDRRMLNFMHRSWGNANNGGDNVVFRNHGSQLEKLDNQQLGMTATRWTLDIATGDLNQDGWTDLYMANDFGRDQLFLNRGDGSFHEVRGRLSGELGKDTYKGMNATMADLDGNGELDIYVSNVHAPLQAEGSLLWLNQGNVDLRGYRAFEDAAMGRNMLNENRFGWGAAVADLNLDGRPDLLQANGMIDDSYDDQYEGCPDYWYWNDRIALTGPDIHGYADRWADVRGRCIFPDQLNRVYLNEGRYFVDVADQVGWTQKGESRGVATVDLDNDGDLDVLVTGQFDPVRIYRNSANSKTGSNPSWIGLSLVGNGRTCNRDAVGTRVSIAPLESSDQAVMVQEKQLSNGFHAQGDSRLVFGLGTQDGPVLVKVLWCGKEHATYTLSDLKRYHRLEQY